MNKKQEFSKELEDVILRSKKFNRVVIWGFLYRYHTHRHIHKGFFDSLKKIGIKTIWLEDDKKNQKYIQKNDLIISADAFGKMMPEKMNFSDYCIPVREDIYYCLHNFKDIFLDKLNPSRVILLDTYKNGAENSDIKIDEVTFIDTKNKFVKLYQPWGTNLMPWEFKKPVFNNHRFVFWVGSIWNDKFNHGNIEEINNLKNTLCEKNIKFINVRFVPDWVNILLVRLSRIAPAIGGRIQTEVNYLPCRMFKNISYGQLGFSNVKKFSDLYKNCLLSGENIEQLVNSALDLSKDEYIRIVKEQQEITKKQTYLQKINNIFKTFDYIK